MGIYTAFTIPNAIAVTQGKGGVGKTTTALEIGKALAVRGTVLFVDLDPQGHVAVKLGFDPDERSGMALRRAVEDGDPLEPVTGAATRIDLIEGGPSVARLRTAIGKDDYGRFYAALAPLAERYDWVVIDTPAANGDILSDAGIALARWLVLPTKLDQLDSYGLITLARRIGTLRAQGHTSAEIAGVLLIGVPPSGTAVEATVREEINDAFDGQAPLFRKSIRFAPAGVRHQTEEGMSSLEYQAAYDQFLDDRNKKGDRDYDARKEAGKRFKVSSLSKDWADVIGELFERIGATQDA
jgi:chromosome partitioning protein